MFCASAHHAISKSNAIALRIGFIELSTKRFNFELNAYHTLKYFITAKIKKSDNDELGADLILFVSLFFWCKIELFISPHHLYDVCLNSMDAWACVYTFVCMVWVVGWLVAWCSDNWQASKRISEHPSWCVCVCLSVHASTG